MESRTQGGDRGQVTQIGADRVVSFGGGNERTWQFGAANFQLSPIGSTQYTSAGTTARVLRTPDGRIVGAKRGAGQYYVTDRQGSIVGWFDTAGRWGGSVVYDPYGQVRFTTGSQLIAQNFLGQFQTGGRAYKLGARFYDADTGRFTQMDPTGQEANPYLYAGGDPCNNTDPTGTATLCSDLITVGSALVGLQLGIGTALISKSVGAGLAVGFGVDIALGLIGNRLCDQVDW